MGRRDETVICISKKDKGIIPEEIKKQPSVLTAGCFSYIVYFVNYYIFTKVRGYINYR